MLSASAATEAPGGGRPAPCGLLRVAGFRVPRGYLPFAHCGGGMGQLASRPPALVWHAAVSCQRGTSRGVASVTAAGTVARRKPLVGSSGAPCLWPDAIKRVGRWQRHGATGTERVDSTRPLLECACLRYLVRRF